MYLNEELALFACVVSLQVIFCAGARSTMTPELMRVDDRGVANIVKALQDENARAAHRARAQQYAGDTSKEAIKARRKLFSGKSKKEIADFSHVSSLCAAMPPLVLLQTVSKFFERYGP